MIHCDTEEIESCVSLSEESFALMPSSVNAMADVRSGQVRSQMKTPDSEVSIGVPCHHTTFANRHDYRGSYLIVLCAHRPS